MIVVAIYGEDMVKRIVGPFETIKEANDYASMVGTMGTGDNPGDWAESFVLQSPPRIKKSQPTA